MEYTAVYERDGEWWAAHVAELQGANTQGATLGEARDNLKEATRLVLDPISFSECTQRGKA